VDAKLPEPSDVEVSANLCGAEGTAEPAFDEVKAQIQQNLKRAKIQQPPGLFLTDLREQAKVIVSLSPPRMEVGFDPARVRAIQGKSDDRGILRFPMPILRTVQSTLKNVLASHEGDRAIAFRDIAGNAKFILRLSWRRWLRAAREQGKFWEYHDLLFGTRQDWRKNG